VWVLLLSSCSELINCTANQDTHITPAASYHHHRLPPPSANTRRYEKELIFYASLHKDVGEFVPLPHILGTFEDPVDPKTFFCIAMENLTEGWDLKNQVVGLSLKEANSIAQLFAKLHAQYWESEILKEDWLATKSVATGQPVGAWFDALVLKWLYEPPAAESKYASGKEQGGPAEHLDRYTNL
jgi:hypothetical protein